MAEEKINELYRIKLNTGDVIAILNDPNQFIVCNVTIIQKGDRAGKEAYGGNRYYTSLVQAIYYMIHMAAKAEAKDLHGYIDSLNKWRRELINAMGDRGLKDPDMKDYF